MKLFLAGSDYRGYEWERNHRDFFFQDRKNVFPKLNKVRLRNSTWYLRDLVAHCYPEARLPTGACFRL